MLADPPREEQSQGNAGDPHQEIEEQERPAQVRRTEAIGYEVEEKRGRNAVGEPVDQIGGDQAQERRVCRHASKAVRKPQAGVTIFARFGTVATVMPPRIMSAAATASPRTASP